MFFFCICTARIHVPDSTHVPTRIQCTEILAFLLRSVSYTRPTDLFSRHQRLENRSQANVWKQREILMGESVILARV